MHETKYVISIDRLRVGGMISMMKSMNLWIDQHLASILLLPEVRRKCRKLSWSEYITINIIQLICEHVIT
jgi:replicative DNA helicase